jgi:Zn-dependent M28 family amino/carboxypeptidase
VLSAGPEIGIELLGRQGFARHAATPLEAQQPGYKPVLLDLEVGATAPLRIERRPMANIIGYLEGTDPTLKSEAVVVTAHYDAMGRTEDGVLLNGASDNAAGVAAMLEIARWLSEPRRRPARSVLLVATDGEEWGLAGSRALVGRLAEVSLKSVAVVNIDSLGSREVADPFLIGGSNHPETRAAVDCLAAALGAHLGRDIDAYAFDDGSDYYPFHLAGVTSVGFFAANYRMLHRSSDSIESLDPAALELAARLAAITIRALAM